MPEEIKMNKVIISYISNKMGHSRYGYIQRVEIAVRYVNEDQLDDVVEQFRLNHEIIEVNISR